MISLLMPTTPVSGRTAFSAERALESLGEAARAAVRYHRALLVAEGRAALVAEIHHQMGRFRLDDGDAPRALEALRQASMAARLAGQAMTPDAVCEIRIDLADALMRLGMMDPARGLMQQASTASGESTLVRLAQTAFRFNEWQGAIDVQRRNVELHPSSALAHFNLAHMLAECSKLEEALAQLARAESLADRPLPGAAALRATIAGRTGDADQALALYRSLSDGSEADRMRSSAAMSALYSHTLTPLQVAELHRELCAPLARDARPRAGFANPRTAARPLRVGVVTSHFVSRMGASFMTAAGLPEWVAEDEQGYVEIARRAAADRRGLLMLQRGLREHLRLRPAWDIETYSVDFGEALQGMWAEWCTQAGDG